MDKDKPNEIHPSRTMEQFHAEVEQVQKSVAAALVECEPSIPVVMECLIGLLMGALYQIEEGEARDKMRTILHKAIDTPECETTVLNEIDPIHNLH